MRSVVAAVVGVIAGIWMMFAPVVLGYSGAAATSDRIVGPSAAAIAWIAATEVTRPLRWINVPLGIWTALSPLVLGVPLDVAVHAVLSGITLAVSAVAIGGVPKDRYAGGWKSLVRKEGSAPT